jgi:hypothetical protein
MRRFNLLAAAAVIATGFAATAPASAEPDRNIPASMQLSQQALIGRITAMAAKPAPVGPEAGRLLAMVSAHQQGHDGALLPVLALLPYIAEDKVTPDMAWALATVDRVKLQQQQIRTEREQITTQLNLLGVAAQNVNDDEALQLARDVAASVLADIEVTEPTAFMIAAYLRTKLTRS